MIIGFVINSAVVIITVLLHYEILNLLSRQLPKLGFRPRFGVMIGVIGSIAAHIIEIVIFALGYFFMTKTGEFGHLSGAFDGSLVDCIYFSLVNYTTLGFGDIQPFGAIRFLAGLEGLVGLVLITWSASFMFIQMQKYWSNNFPD